MFRKFPGGWAQLDITAMVGVRLSRPQHWRNEKQWTNDTGGPVANGIAAPEDGRTPVAARNYAPSGFSRLPGIDPSWRFCYLPFNCAMKTSLNQHVLVLNRLWQAVNVCTARRALTLLFQGQAQVVVNAEDGSFRTFDFEEWRDFSGDAQHEESVRTISFRIRVPRIILLLIYDRLPKKEVKFTRHNIFERDKNTCQYCGRVFDRKDLNLDHVIPRDRGGPTTWENIVCSCIECNTQKANRTPQEAALHLIRKPKRPKWRPFVQINFSLHRHDSWKHFIDLAYWNVELGEDVE